MKKFCVQFCKALKAIRANSGKGQIAFARDLGLVQPVYARYESGAREPTLNELIRIANVLQITPNQLLGYDDPLSAPPRETKTEITAGDHSPVVNGIGNIIGNSINIPPPKSTSPSASPSTSTARKRKAKK